MIIHKVVVSYILYVKKKMNWAKNIIKNIITIYNIYYMSYHDPYALEQTVGYV